VKKSLFLFGLLITGLLLTPAHISAAQLPPVPSTFDYIVDKDSIGGTCSDNGPGNISQPFCSISKALSVANAGTKIGIRRGVYPPFEVTNSGISGSYLIIAGYGNEKPHISGVNGIKLSGKSYVRISGFEVSGATNGYSGGGIYLSASNNNIIDNNITRDNLGGFTSGINLNVSSNNVIQGNVSFNNGLKGIRVAQGANNQIISNHCYGNRGNGGGSDGITTTEGSSGNLIKDNIVHHNSDDGIDTWSSHGNTVTGNIAYENLGPGDGNGFKLGGTESGGQHLVIANISYKNKRDGFDSNHSYGNTYYNNTAFGNGGVGFRDVDKFPNCNYANCKTVYINNIGYNNNKNFAASPHTAISHNNIWYSDTGGAAITYQGSTVFNNLESFYSASGNRLDNPNNGNLSSFSVNPLFINANAANFNLVQNSPAINKGDPANPGNVAAVSIPDIGAKEFSGNNNPSPTQPPTNKTGDVNRDGRVDIVDIGIIIDNYGRIPIQNRNADVNSDSVVNIIDIGLTIDFYGT
jgi:parallel beta-helix repeat protein